MKTNGKKMLSICVVLAALLIGLAFVSTNIAIAQGSELRVLCSDGMKPVLIALTPQIERSIGRRLNLKFDSSKNIVNMITAGEAFDVTILTTATIDDLIKQGKLTADSRIELSRVGAGVGFREGAPKPDISTPEAMKRALLKAKFVSYNNTGATSDLIHSTFDRLGIAAEMKLKMIGDSVAGGAQTKVAEGKADLVIILIPEVTAVPGVKFAGPFPKELQGYIEFAGAVAPSAHDPEKAKALLQFITTPTATRVMKAKGIEPH